MLAAAAAYAAGFAADAYAGGFAADAYAAGLAAAAHAAGLVAAVVAVCPVLLAGNDSCFATHRHAAIQVHDAYAVEKHPAGAHRNQVVLVVRLGEGQENGHLVQRVACRAHQNLGYTSLVAGIAAGMRTAGDLESAGTRGTLQALLVGQRENEDFVGGAEAAEKNLASAVASHVEVGDTDRGAAGQGIAGLAAVGCCTSLRR